MYKRMIAIVAMTACFASQCTAAGLFNLRKPTTRSRQSSKLPLSVLKSPEKMTKRFGPSVLIAKPAKKAEETRKFVTQPD